MGGCPDGAVRCPDFSMIARVVAGGSAQNQPILLYVYFRLRGMSAMPVGSLSGDISGRGIVKRWSCKLSAAPMWVYDQRAAYNWRGTCVRLYGGTRRSGTGKGEQLALIDPPQLKAQPELPLSASGSRQNVLLPTKKKRCLRGPKCFGTSRAEVG